jgi:hypothetical protein
MGRIEPMKTSLTLACAASLLLSFVLPGDQVRFAVKDKSKLSKVFDDKAVLHSTSFSMTVDGEDAGADMPELKISFEELTHVAVTDAYGQIKDGKPSKVTRSYDKLGGTSTQKVELPEGMDAHGDPNEVKERSSELEGKTVVFKLDDDGESYKADFADGKGDAKLLEDLKEDMDLRGFLPRGEVSEDKSWEIEAAVFNSVLGSPGGDLKINTKDDKDDDSDIDQQFEDNLKGKGKGTYKGKREVDGHHCAVIALEAELKTSGKDDKAAEGGGHNGVKTIKLEYTVEGELLWDVDEGHFLKCTLSSKIKMTMQDVLSMETDEGKHEMQQTVEFEGEGEFSAGIGG